jgi:hypothetical protein
LLRGKLVAQNTETSNWVEIYRTADEWEVKLVQATLANQHIRCRPIHIREERQVMLLVAPEDEVEALEIVSRIGLAITVDQARNDQTSRAETAVEETELPRATPATVENMLIAEREGIGAIVHYIGRGYELQVGPEPYGMVEEDRWEEFTDFSAQRQEFAMLLKHEYPMLFQWLKQRKLMSEFIRLVESTYREVPPPRPREVRQPSTDAADATETDGTRTSNLAKLSLGLSLISVVAKLSFPWYACLALALLGFVTGFIAKYRIDDSDGHLKGKPLALIAGIIACIVIVSAIF